MAEQERDDHGRFAGGGGASAKEKGIQAREASARATDARTKDTHEKAAAAHREAAVAFRGEAKVELAHGDAPGRWNAQKKEEEAKEHDSQAAWHEGQAKTAGSTPHVSNAFKSGSLGNANQQIIKSQNLGVWAKKRGG